MQEPKKDNAEKDGWSSDEITDQAAPVNEDDVKRQILRDDESKGDPDDRDIAGATDSEDTAHGREETKNPRGVL